MAGDRRTYRYALAGLFLALAAFCAAVRPVSAGDSEASAPERAREVRVGIFAVEPLVFQDEQGGARGIFVDLLKSMASERGWRLTFVPGSFDEGVSRLRQGRIDLLAPFAYSRERSEFFDYSREPVLTVWSEVYVRPQSLVRNILDLQGHTVAVMKGDINARNFQDLAAQFHISCDYLEVPSLAEAFGRVRDGEADAAVTPMFFGYANAAEYGLVSSSIVFQPFPVFFATAKGHNGDLLAAIDDSLQRWEKEANSPYNRSLDHWFARGRGYSGLPSWLLASLLVLALSTLVFAFWARRLKNRVGQQTRNLQENEEKYREVFNSTSEAIIVRDAGSGAILDVNRAMTEMYGYSREEALRLTVDDLSLGRSPYSQKEADRYTAKALAGEPQVFEWQGRRKDGSHFPCEVSMQSHRIGSQLRITEVIRDTSDRKLLETQLMQAQKMEALRKLEQQVVLMQKMEAIGTLAGGIAHDFNNILGPILVYTELVQERLSADEELTADLQQVVAAALRAKDLVQQILTFSRHSAQEKRPLQPQPVVKEAMKLLRATLPATIEVRQEIATDCGMILIDPTQLHQIVMNLCTNAYHAMRQSGGVLSVTLSCRMLGAKEEQEAGLTLEPGEYVQLQVCDTGGGIPPQGCSRMVSIAFGASLTSASVVPPAYMRKCPSAGVSSTSVGSLSKL